MSFRGCAICNRKTAKIVPSGKRVMKHTMVIKPTTLVLGELSAQTTSAFQFEGLVQLSCDEITQLDRSAFEALAPKVVLSPLFCEGLDCIDFGQFLTDMKFDGRYLILADDLPNPTMISREFKQLYPTLEFEILTTKEIFARLDR